MEKRQPGSSEEQAGPEVIAGEAERNYQNIKQQPDGSDGEIRIFAPVNGAGKQLPVRLKQ